MTETAPDPTQDADRAIMFAATHRHEVRWCPEWERWIVWNGKYWESDAGGLIVQLKCSNFIRTTTGIRNMMQLVKSHVVTHSDEFDAHPHLLNTPTGILDLMWKESEGDVDPETGPNYDLDVYRHPHDPEKLLTKMTGVSWEPTRTHVWDHHAQEMVKLPPSRWQRHLDRVQPDPEVQDYLQRWAGYMLCGKINQHEMLVLEGDGANGKSVFIDTILGVLGNYAAPGAHSLLIEKPHDDHPTAIAQTKGLRMVVVAETPRGARINEARLSHLTGGDPMQARRMREDWWTFKPTAKLIMTTNHRPDISTQTEAIWRRLRRVPWLETISKEEMVDGLSDILIATEGKIVFDWMFNGWFKYLLNGLALPDVLAKSNEQYRQEQDVIGQYIEEMSYNEGSTNDLKVTCSDFNYGFDAWCKTSGMIRPTRNEKTRMMEKKGFIRRKWSGSWYWFGLQKADTANVLQQMRNPT